MSPMKRTTEADYRKRIARVVAAIVADPTAPHTIEELAAVANFSPFHFHRIYRALAGESVMATVRRVRLTQAANRLAAGVGSITEIALDVGYESPQSFARAFRDFFRIRPSEFLRRGLDGAGMVPRAGVGQPLAIGIVDHPALRVHALRHPGPLGTITDTYRQLRHWREAHGMVAACPAVGLCYDDLEDEKGLRYYASAVLPGGVPASDGVEILEVPGGRYACHRLVAPFGMIDPTFRLLYGTWLPNSGFEPDDRPAIELYRTAPTMTPCRVPVIDLMIPIRAAA